MAKGVSRICQIFSKKNGRFAASSLLRRCSAVYTLLLLAIGCDRTKSQPIPVPPAEPTTSSQPSQPAAHELGSQAAGTPSPPTNRRRNLLIVTIDTCRADRIGCYGYGLARTPTIDRIAKEGVRCDDAITTAPITAVAHASLLTGLLPPAHGVRDNGAYALDDQFTTLAEHCRTSGYATAAFVSAQVLNRRYNLTQGFETYDDDLSAENEAALFMIRDRNARRTAERVTAWFDKWERQPAPPPFFVWVHFFDPHQPYEAKVSAPHLIPTPYDREIAVVDEALATIVARLESSGAFDQTVTIVTADHGESLGEHDEQTHAIFVYDATVRIPLIVRSPGMLPANTVYSSPASIVDIPATALAALGLGPLGDTDGVDLLAALAGRAPSPDRSQYSESLASELGFGMAPLHAVRWRGFKYIRAPRPELYDLRADPRELDNVISKHESRATEMSRILDRMMTPRSGHAPAARSVPMDQETTSMLRALGYVASDDDRAGMDGIDPKDGIRQYNKLETARHFAQADRWTECERELRELLAAAPANASARNILALSLTRQSRWREAEQEYAESLRASPNQARVLGALGFLKIQLDELDAAESVLQQALRLTPRYVEAMANLGFVETLRGNQAAADAWFKRAEAEDPQYPRMFRAYADLFFQRGDYASAYANYKKTLTAVPNDFPSLIQCGACARRVGEMAAAADYNRRAAQLRPDAWIPPYNLACLKALAGDAQGALADLAIAVANGLDSADRVLADADFTALRQRPDFVALVERLRSSRKLPGDK